MKFIDQLDDMKKEVIRYLVVGFFTTVVGLGVYVGCTFTFLDARVGLEMQLANVISWLVAVVFAFIMNRNYVYKVKKPVFDGLLKFFLSRIGSLILEMTVMFVGVTIIGIRDIYVKLMGQLIVVLANYIFGKFWVFRE